MGRHKAIKENPNHIYCVSCKQWGWVTDWYIDWALPKRGKLRPALRAVCPKGHATSTWIPMWVAPHIGSINPGRFHWADLDFAKIAQIAYIAREAYMIFMDTRNRVLQELHANGATVPALAELFELESNYVSRIVQASHRKYPPKRKNRRYEKRRSGHPAEAV